MAQTYTEIFENGWGQASHSCKPALIDLDNDGLLDLIVGEYLGNLKHYEQEDVNSKNFTLISEIFKELEIGKFTAPCFLDLDNDGLLDMIVGEQAGNLNHYEQDSFNSYAFTLISEYFNEIDVGSGSTPFFIDLDNNGLLDLLIGENDGIINHYQQDSLNTTSFTLISDSLSAIYIGKWSVPTFTDLNNNGLLDIIIGESSGNLYYYEQETINTLDFLLISDNFSGIQVTGHAAPVFTDLDNNGLLDMIVGDSDGFLNHFEQDTPGSINFDPVTDKLITGVIDVGSAATPCFVDLDNDGLLDMIVGEYDGNINHYEQETIGSGKFNLLSDKFNGIDLGMYTSPIVADMGNNNLLDLVIGNYDGKIFYYEQIAQYSDSFTLVSDNFNGIEVGSSAEPAFTDLDNDGLLDMIIGENGGNLNHYEQETSGSIVFTLITDSMSGINIQRWIRPCFTDLDNNGLLDMIVGEYDGNLNHYSQNSTGSNDFTLVTENFQEIHVGNKSRPIFVDINNDDLEDLLVGDTDGGIHYYQRDKETFIEEKMYIGVRPSTFRLIQNYPNPFNPSTIIEFVLPKISDVTLNIYNILGEKVSTLVSDRLSAGSYSYEWDASDLSSGVYLYRLETEGFVETKKMILMR
jgi:hypothetical protein